MSVYHPTGVSIEIVGIESNSNGRSCEEHDCCGIVLDNDVVVRFRRVQIQVDGMEETAIAAFWVTDGVDRCRVGFLPRYQLKHWQQYEGRLAQIIDMYRDSDSPAKKKETSQE